MRREIDSLVYVGRDGAVRWDSNDRLVDLDTLRACGFHEGAVESTRIAGIHEEMEREAVRAESRKAMGEWASYQFANEPIFRHGIGGAL